MFPYQTESVISAVVRTTSFIKTSTTKKLINPRLLKVSQVCIWRKWGHLNRLIYSYTDRQRWAVAWERIRAGSLVRSDWKTDQWMPKQERQPQCSHSEDAVTVVLKNKRQSKLALGSECTWYKQWHTLRSCGGNSFEELIMARKKRSVICSRFFWFSSKFSAGSSLKRRWEVKRFSRMTMIKTSVFWRVFKCTSWRTPLNEIYYTPFTWCNMSLRCPQNVSEVSAQNIPQIIYYIVLKMHILSGSRDARLSMSITLKSCVFWEHISEVHTQKAAVTRNESTKLSSLSSLIALKLSNTHNFTNTVGYVCKVGKEM